MITQEKIDALKAALIEACDKHLAEGGAIGSGVFVSFSSMDPSSSEQPSMCPLGCLSDGVNYFEKANQVLGVSPSDRSIWDFVSAFDGNQGNEWANSPLTLLGRELRDKYLNK